MSLLEAPRPPLRAPGHGLRGRGGGGECCVVGDDRGVRLRNFSDHTAEEDGVCSSDSSLFRRARDLYTDWLDDEVTSQFSRRGGGLAWGQSKENLRVEVRAAIAFTRKCSSCQDRLDSSSHERYIAEQKLQDFGPPSAPPIARDGEVDGIFDTVGNYP